jgi:hypothetical protein
MFLMSLEITINYLFFTYECELNFCGCFLNKIDLNVNYFEWILVEPRQQLKYFYCLNVC